MNATQYLRKGLGNTPPALPASVVNYQVPVPQSPAPAGNIWSGINNFLSNLSNTVKTVTPIVSNVQQTVNQLKNGQPVYTGQTNFTMQQAQVQPQSSIAKKVLIVVGIAGAAYLGYRAFRPSKK